FYFLFSLHTASRAVFYSLSLHDALPISFMANYAHPELLVSTEWVAQHGKDRNVRIVEVDVDTNAYNEGHVPGAIAWAWNTQLSRSEEHTSELQSRFDLVCRLLLEKKKKK